ncbi:MAG: 1,4-alpha-glucan branching protein GlgB [Lysobacterales bacterium]
MLDAAAIEALLSARHGDPFGVLGLHHDVSGVLWLRVLLPGARSVDVLDVGSTSTVATLEARHPDGVFEARLGVRERFDYRLRVQWSSGASGVYADAYAYGSLIEDAELQAFHEGRHGRPYALLGAHPVDLGRVAGTRFAVWAPNARRVSVVGSFNDWDGRRHPMRLRHQAGVWEIAIPHVGPGDYYKYEVLGADGALLPLKADPYAFAAELRPGTASRVAGLPPVRALPAGRAEANQRQAPISVYEVHIGSWRRAADGGAFPNWRELAQTLPAYAADLGFTHLELLPISEHPFDGSWGYQPLGLYAPSARYGSAEDFAVFVAACHAHGLGLLLDWVPAHFPADAHGLAQFDGTALYEYADPREGFHRDWNTLIPNFGRTEVQSYLIGSARYWLERFGVDGLRVDAVASMLYRDYSRNAGEWVPNHLGGRENLEAIALLRRLSETVGAELPGAITIAEESTAFPGVSAPTYAGGLGFHYKWNMGWMNDTLRYVSTDPVHRRWHHDQMTFGLVYAFSENYVLPISHDEVVHGKGSMLGKMPGDDWQRFANLRAYYGYMWGHPGKKLLFMGQEFAQPGEWRDVEALPWHLLDDARHAGVQRLIRDLNQLYRHTPALHRLDCEASGFEWLVGDDRDQSVFAWARFDRAGGVAIVISNFTPVPRTGYRLPLPEGAARWREALNTDSAHYGGSDVGNGGRVLEAEAIASHGRAHSLTLTLPPLATLVLLPA